MASNDLVLGGHNKLIASYADYISYPLDAKNSLSRMAQFMSVTDEDSTDPRAVKGAYINYIKNILFDIAEADQVSPDVLAEIEEEFDHGFILRTSNKSVIILFADGPYIREEN